MTPVGPDSGWDREQGAWNLGRLSASLKIQVLLCMCNVNPPFQVHEPRLICVSSAWNLGTLFCCAFENIAVQLIWTKTCPYNVVVTILASLERTSLSLSAGFCGVGEEKRRPGEKA